MTAAAAGLPKDDEPLQGAQGLPEDPVAPVLIEPEDTGVPEPRGPLSIEVKTARGVAPGDLGRLVKPTIEGLTRCVRDLRLVAPDLNGKIRLETTLRRVSGKTLLTRLLVVPDPGLSPLATCAESPLRSLDWSGLALETSRAEATLELRLGD